MFWKLFFCRSLSAEEFEQSLRIFVFKFLVFIIITIFFQLLIFIAVINISIFFMTNLLTFM